jgi:hypothetical protein
MYLIISFNTDPFKKYLRDCNIDYHPSRMQFFWIYISLDMINSSMMSINILYHHHHLQPVNVPTAGAQAFLIDYT